MTDLRIREAVRALILDEGDNLLLVHFDWPGLAIDGGFWACPGGGVDTDEDHDAALRRELHEELGLSDVTVLGPVWCLTRIFPMTHWDGQRDTTYLVRVERFDPRPRVDLVAENVHGVRWFSLDELADEGVTFSPRDLSAQLRIVLTEGVPSTPREIPALP